jgi:hypothetical protein
MPIDLKSPLAQALIQVGQQRGYRPLDIAASIGNASQESGFRTDALGDNGSAHGGFQWRLDRFGNLQKTAGAMGKAWTDPLVQANHWYNELEGSEKRNGDRLRAATTPEDANAAVVMALRPAGSQNGPTSAHNWDGRLNAVKEAFGLLGQDGGGSGTSVAAANPADIPAPGAQDASFQMPQQAPPKEGWEGFLSGGPGALFGHPQQGWNIGDTLTGVGAAMMARDKPEGAAVLAKMLDKRNKLMDDDDPTVQIDSARGIAYKTYKGGRVQVEQIRQPDEKPMPLGTQKLFQDNNNKADTAKGVLQKNQEFMELLKDGKIDMSAYSRLGNSLKNFTDQSDEGTWNAARLQAHLQDMVNARLLDAKGTQTEGDAQRALDSFLPGLAKYDNKTAAAMLRDINKGFESAWTRNAKYNEPIFRQYPSFDPDGGYKKSFENDWNSYTARRDKYEKDYSAWTAAPKPSQTPADPTKTPTGRDPLKSPHKPKSFLDFY